jgi:hypothetical protein
VHAGKPCVPKVHHCSGRRPPIAVSAFNMQVIVRSLSLIYLYLKIRDKIKDALRDR